MNRVVAVIQARIGSQRLPGKVLRWIHGAPMIGRIAERLAYSDQINNIVIACSDNPADNRIAQFAKSQGIPCYCGSEAILDARLLKAARAASADAIVRITADCPLVDAGIVDDLVGIWRANPKLEYVSNVWPNRTYPDGLDVEVVSLGALEFITDKQDGDPWDHETFTTNIWKHPHLFGGIESLDLPDGQTLGDLRWTVDRADDLYFVRWVYDQLPDGFDWTEVMELRHEWLRHVSNHWHDFRITLPVELRNTDLPGLVALRFGR